MAIMSHIGACRALLQNDPGEFWWRCLFWSFWLHLALFPLGYGFREFMPHINLLCLLYYYRYRWHESILHRLTILPLFYCLWLMIILGVVFSMNRWHSFMHALVGINKGYIIPFIAMECVRDLKDLRRLVLACVTALVWEGLDGVWQWFTGWDIIMHYPLHDGRLTSSLDDYWVGNYVALVLVPASGLWYIMRRDHSVLRTLFYYVAVFWPAYFLFVGAAARAGLVALAGALFLWLLLARGRIFPEAILVPAVLVAAFFFFLPGRGSLDVVQADGRWSLWALAWTSLRQSPFFGAGIWQYNYSFRSLGLIPAKDAVTISHPHNIYLDLLCSHGVVGTLIGCIFLFGVILWILKYLTPRLQGVAKGDYENSDLYPEAIRHEAGCSSLYWQLTGLFFVGYIAWLLNGVFGHDFYRNWWLTIAMAHLGIAIGALNRGREGEARFCIQSAGPDSRP